MWKYTSIRAVTKDVGDYKRCYQCGRPSLSPTRYLGLCRGHLAQALTKGCVIDLIEV